MLAFVKHIIPTIGSTLASGGSLGRDDETRLEREREREEGAHPSNMVSVLPVGENAQTKITDQFPMPQTQADEDHREFTTHTQRTSVCVCREWSTLQIIHEAQIKNRRTVTCALYSSVVLSCEASCLSFSHTLRFQSSSFLPSFSPHLLSSISPFTFLSSFHSLRRIHFPSFSSPLPFLPIMFPSPPPLNSPSVSFPADN